MFRILPSNAQRRRPSEQVALDAWLGETKDVTGAALAETAVPPPLMTVIRDVDVVMLEEFDIATATGRHTDVGHLYDRTVARLRVMWLNGRSRPHLPQAAVPSPDVDSSVKNPIETRFLR